MPDAVARSAILRLLLRGKPVDEVDGDAVAKKSEGYSGADLKAVMDITIENKLKEAKAPKIEFTEGFGFVPEVCSPCARVISTPTLRAKRSADGFSTRTCTRCTWGNSRQMAAIRSASASSRK